MLKPFFGWAWEAGLVSADTFMLVRRIAPPAKSSARGLPRPYKRPELTKFWAELDAAYPWLDRPDYYWPRFARGTTPFRRVRKEAARAQFEAMIALALQCGLRRQEIYDCSIDDMHPDNEYVVVREGKGGKMREVPHTDASREAIQKWLEVRHRLKPRHSRPWLNLWGTKKKDWAGAMSFYKFEKLFNKLGSGWELHRFRHTCGTEWLRSTERIELVRKLLGHSNITQTEGYAEVVRDDLHDAMNRSQRQFQDRVGQAVAA
jgi:integrase